MIKNLEAQKANIKENISKAIDEYCDKFSRCSDAPRFSIDTIEKLMLEQQNKIRESLNEFNSELTSSINIECKKNALSAERH